METVCVRLRPGSKLREAIYDLAQKHEINAGIVLTCVGSLQEINIRLAGGEETLCKQDSYEILSLSGTFNNLNQGHFHISLADKNGNCLGGHLLTDNIVATTVELVVGIITNKKFLREKDSQTGYLELNIKDDLLR